MISLSEKIRIEMRDRPKAWRSIASLVLSSEEKLLRMKLKDVSLMAGVSEGSVINFVRSLGYPGFVEFKVALAQDRGEINPRYSASEDTLSLVLDSACDALSEARSLDTALINTLAKRLAESRAVAVVGMGTSHYVAEILAGYLVRIGITAFVPDEPNLAARTLSDGDTVVAISYSGETEIILSALENSRKRGAYAAAITAFPRSSLSLSADISLSVGLRESAEGEFPLVARVVQLAIIDALCSATISAIKVK